jgi:hypothetical protein
MRDNDIAPPGSDSGEGLDLTDTRSRTLADADHRPSCSVLDVQQDHAQCHRTRGIGKWGQRARIIPAVLCCDARQGEGTGLSGWTGHPNV